MKRSCLSPRNLSQKYLLVRARLAGIRERLAQGQSGVHEGTGEGPNRVRDRQQRHTDGDREVLGAFC